MVIREDNGNVTCIAEKSIHGIQYKKDEDRLLVYTEHFNYAFKLTEEEALEYIDLFKEYIQHEEQIVMS